MNGFFGTPEETGHNSFRPYVSLSKPPQLTDVVIYYQNTRGLKTKLQDWYHGTCTLDAQLIAVTESWLDDSVHDAEVCGPDWSILRRDRPTRSGGVFLAANKGLVINRRADLESTTGEDLWASITLHKVKIYVCVLYIPPNATEDDFLLQLESIERACVILMNERVIILGDFNLYSATVDANNYFQYFLSFCNLIQFNDVKNERGRVLDLVLMQPNTQTVVERAADPLVRIDVLHPPLIINIRYTLKRDDHRMEVSNINPNTDWNFGRCDFSSLYTKIKNIDWSNIYSFTCVSDAVDYFYNNMYLCINACTPNKIRSN